jgi:PadR family transcriptional regulator, regulatory protein PadR
MISGADHMSDIQETLQSLTQELRRGTVVIGVLSQLSEPQYGYSLVSILEEKGFTIDPGTLYPLLRRLEKQNLLESKWDTNEARPRKYYLLSPSGKEVYRQLCKEWESMKASLEVLLEGGS